MNLCACGFASIDHWGHFPEGGCVKAPKCAGFQKATTIDTVPDAPPSTTADMETPSSLAPVTDSPTGAPAATDENLNAPPATASDEGPTGNPAA